MTGVAVAAAAAAMRVAAVAAAVVAAARTAASCPTIRSPGFGSARGAGTHRRHPRHPLPRD